VRVHARTVTRHAAPPARRTWRRPLHVSGSGSNEIARTRGADSAATVEGEAPRGFPDNPNGAEADAAAVCNAAGNVLALMPHPERAQDLGGVGRRVGGEWGAKRDAALERGEVDAEGPGLALFHGLRRHLETT